MGKNKEEKIKEIELDISKIEKMSSLLKEIEYLNTDLYGNFTLLDKDIFEDFNSRLKSILESKVVSKYYLSKEV